MLFAQEHNLRVVIRNTGHDYAGRSVAPESLQINTHLMTSKNMHKNFKPTGSNGIGEGLAVTLGAGVQLYDMYKWLGEHEIMVVGGSSHGVGVTGGYVQGGGHSMFGPVRGMASDNVLEFRIVTADVSVNLPAGQISLLTGCRASISSRMPTKILISSGPCVEVVEAHGELSPQ